MIFYIQDIFVFTCYLFFLVSLGETNNDTFNMILVSQPSLA